jgi:hypothetical protein
MLMMYFEQVDQFSQTNEDDHAVNKAPSDFELTDHDSPHPVVVAIAVARSWFCKLCSEGTVPMASVVMPVPVDPDQVAIAMAFLCNVKPTKTVRSNAGMFSNDLANTISKATGKPVSNGACVAACVALGFTVRTWYGVKGFRPDGLIGVGRRNVRRQQMAD